MGDVHDVNAVIAGEAAGLRPEQWPGLAHILRATAADEREACARIASGCSDRDCDDRGVTDPETGEVPCAAETRGEVCVCAEWSELAHTIAAKIRARATT